MRAAYEWDFTAFLSTNLVARRTRWGAGAGAGAGLPWPTLVC